MSAAFRLLSTNDRRVLRTRWRSALVIVSRLAPGPAHDGALAVSYAHIIDAHGVNSGRSAHVGMTGRLLSWTRDSCHVAYALQLSSCMSHEGRFTELGHSRHLIDDAFGF